MKPYVLICVYFFNIDPNQLGKMQGRNGLPLNSTGVEQAETLRQALKHVSFDVAFSSPQERAVKTAEIISGIDVVCDHRIDVFDLGTADGLARNEVKMMNGVPDPKVYEGVENPSEFINRVFSFMKEIEIKFGNDANILICGHRCTTGCIGAYFEGIPKDGDLLIYSSNTGTYKQYEFK